MNYDDAGIQQLPHEQTQKENIGHPGSLLAEADSYNKLGCKHFNNNELDLAIKYFTMAAEFNDSNVAKYMANRGAAYHHKKYLSLAIKDFSFAISHKPNFPAAYKMRACVFSDKYEKESKNSKGKKKDLESAISDFTQAIQLEPNEVDLYRYRAECYDLLDEVELSFTDISRVIELENPPDKTRLLNLGIAYAMKGDWYQAFEHFKQANKIVSEKAVEILKICAPHKKKGTGAIEILKDWYLSRFEEISKDSFYLKLKEFIEQDGTDIFDKKNFYALLSDFLKNEYKTDSILLCRLVDRQIHKEIFLTENFEETRKNIITNFVSSDSKKSDIGRMVDIVYCLTQDEEFFRNGGQKWEELWPSI